MLASLSNQMLAQKYFEIRNAKETNECLTVWEAGKCYLAIERTPGVPPRCDGSWPNAGVRIGDMVATNLTIEPRLRMSGMEQADRKRYFLLVPAAEVRYVVSAASRNCMRFRAVQRLVWQS